MDLSPQGMPVAERVLSFRPQREGQWNIQVQVDGRDAAPEPCKIVVIDAEPLARPATYKPLAGGKLIADIDCTAPAPKDQTYAGSDDVRVVTGPAGRYRLAGPGGKGPGHAPGSNSYFGYKLSIAQPKKLHKVVVEYPDDDYRSFLLHLPSQWEAAG